MVGKSVLAVSRELRWKHGPQTFVPLHISLSMRSLNFIAAPWLGSKNEHPKIRGIFQTCLWKSYSITSTTLCWLRHLQKLPRQRGRGTLTLPLDGSGEVLENPWDRRHCCSHLLKIQSATEFSHSIFHKISLKCKYSWKGNMINSYQSLMSY